MERIRLLNNNQTNTIKTKKKGKHKSGVDYGLDSIVFIKKEIRGSEEAILSMAPILLKKFQGCPNNRCRLGPTPVRRWIQ